MYYPFFNCGIALAGKSNLAAILDRSVRRQAEKEEASMNSRADHFVAARRGSRGLRSGGRAYFLLGLLALPACRLDSQLRIAERILDRYRRATASKPLPLSHVVRMKLRPDRAGDPATGFAEVAWEPNRYRERVSSAGVTTERGIQGGKAYAIDEDGFTRVVSEPVLRELHTRSYFWRKAWLFQDRERARLSLGPADAAAVSLRFLPLGGNPLLLSFSRRDGRLTAVRSPRFDVDFGTDGSFRLASGIRPRVVGEVAWSGLPSERIADAAVSGACGKFVGRAEVPFERTARGGLTFPAAVNGVAMRLALDGTADGPLRLSPEAARRLGVSFTTDVYGRAIAAGATLAVGTFSCPGIHVEGLTQALDEADGVVGGTLDREAVVEIDAGGRRLALHDPNRWVSPAGFTRIIVDDDGDRPVTTLRRGSRVVRLTVAAPTGSTDLSVEPDALERLEISAPGTVGSLRWGILELPDLSVERDTRLTPAGWGDDGKVGFAMLLRFHSHLDLTHRWIYVRPVGR